MLDFQRCVVLQLDDGELLPWPPRRPVSLTVVTGRIWLTRSNDPDDHFIDAGQPALQLRPGDGAIVGGEGRALVRLAPLPPAPLRWLRGLLGALVQRRRGPTMPGWTCQPTS